MRNYLEEAMDQAQREEREIPALPELPGSPGGQKRPAAGTPQTPQPPRPPREESPAPTSRQREAAPAPEETGAPERLPEEALETLLQRQWRQARSAGENVSAPARQREAPEGSLAQRLIRSGSQTAFARGGGRRLTAVLPQAPKGNGLDAQGLDRAVERDARRYDGGFGLY